MSSRNLNDRIKLSRKRQLSATSPSVTSKAYKNRCKLYFLCLRSPSWKNLATSSQKKRSQKLGWVSRQHPRRSTVKHLQLNQPRIAQSMKRSRGQANLSEVIGANLVLVSEEYRLNMMSVISSLLQSFKIKREWLRPSTDREWRLPIQPSTIRLSSAINLPKSWGLRSTMLESDNLQFLIYSIQYFSISVVIMKINKDIWLKWCMGESVWLDQHLVSSFDFSLGIFSESWFFAYILKQVFTFGVVEHFDRTALEDVLYLIILYNLIKLSLLLL